MPNELPARGPLTDLLVDHLEASTRLTQAGVLVGDATTPSDAGWTKIQPGQDAFVASVTLTTGQSYPGPSPERVRSRHTSWRCTYGLRSVGGARTQADHAADLARAAMLDLPRGRVRLGADDWQVEDVVFGALAPVVKKDPTDHPTYELDDTFEVWLTRG